jgi:prevent-host-death family protein
VTVPRLADWKSAIQQIGNLRYFPSFMQPCNGNPGGPPNLRGLRGKGIFAAVSTISISELKKKPAGAWLKSAAKHDLVITSKGQPVAVLVRIAAASVDSTRALLRSVRALQAQAALQQTATANGTASLSMSDIDAEIAAARRARRRK